MPCGTIGFVLNAAACPQQSNTTLSLSLCPCRMWSIWMFTIPSLRARDCKPAEKDALNILFLLVPVINVALPFVWKSFPAIFSADVVALFAIYFYKRVWQAPSQA